jgi:thiol-disulfide isomerase/thioredoxin
MTAGDVREEQGPVRAPEFPAGALWLQGGPITMASQQGKVVLIDFWDYTCVNCLRTLPYVKEWHRKYGPLGLVTVGVHAPEFSFAREQGNVLRAVREHGIDYVVLLDNDYATWQAWANRYWPAKYLVDKQGYLRYLHFGEGGYAETEEAIRTLLKEGFAELLLPGAGEPLRTEDAPGVVCYRVTPELYLGYARGLYGNPSLLPDVPAPYADPGMHMDGHTYLEGDWLLTTEYLARPAGASALSRMHVPYLAKDVNIVAHPPAYGGGGVINVLQDGAPLPAENAGEDVVCGATSVLNVDVPRMYRVVSNREIGRHELTLETRSDGLTLYALTFTSCVIPGEERPESDG